MTEYRITFTYCASLDAKFRHPSAMVATTGSDGSYEVYARIVKSFGYEHIAEVKLVMDEPSWLRSDLSQEDVNEALDRTNSSERNSVGGELT